jgi:filamentous hemagglutinin
MADTIRISGLNEIASGALDDNSVVPVTDGGVTYKLPISKLKAFVGDSFATDAELSAQVSTINSTINGLDTDDISEGSNKYYTDGRVKTKLNVEGVISASSQVSIAYDDLTGIPDGIISSSTQVSASAAAAGFGAGGANLSGTNVVSSSAQISEFNTFVENSITSSMTVLSASYATTASYAENAGGGGGNDYISNVVISGTSLIFTGEGNAFSNSVNLSDGDVLTTDDGDSVYLDYNTYLLDSESFASRVGSGGGGSSIPDGTVSSSIQVLGGTDIISSSIQIAELGAGIISSSGQIGAILTTDDINEGTLNFYFTDAKVKTKLNADGVLSGSISGDWNTLANKPVDIVSSSGQVGDFGYITITPVNDLSESVNTRIDNITGLDPDSTNIFTAEQRFAGGIKLTGSIEIQPDGGVSYFSGSGLGLTNIPAENIVGALSAGTSISQGDTSIFTNADSTITLNASTTGSILLTAARGVILTTGSYSGSGANLYDIPQSAIIGGGGSGFGDKIVSGSSSASIDTDYLFKVNTGSVFDGDMVVSGSITADSISVGTTGTPTLYSSTNINLSASNAVVVTDSPLRLSPQSTSDIAGFSLSTGDIVYNETDNQFQGYINGNWVQLSFTGSDALPAVDLGGTGVISGSQQIAELGANIVSASAQLVSERSILNTEILFVENASITGSTNFAYNRGTNTLSVGTIEPTDITFTGTLSGPAGSSGSFGRLLGDSLRINNAIEFPTSDGVSPNQVLKTDGAGNIDFATVETLITTQDINTTGTITIGTGSVIGTGSISLEDTLSVAGTINDQTISSANTVIESTNVRVQSGGQLLLSSSNADLGVVIDDVLVLPERDNKPNTPRTGSIIVSASASGPRPYFYDGTDWTVMF